MICGLKSGGGGRERERERQTDRHTETHRDTQRDRERDRDTETERQRLRDRDRDRETERGMFGSYSRWGLISALRAMGRKKVRDRQRDRDRSDFATDAPTSSKLISYLNELPVCSLTASIWFHRHSALIISLTATRNKLRDVGRESKW